MGVVAIAAVAVAGLLAVNAFAGGGAPFGMSGAATASPTVHDATPASTSPTPSEASGPHGSAGPSTSTASPSGTPAPSASALSTPSAGAPAGPVAPTSAEGFRLRKTVIDIAFPFHAASRYRYGERFLAPRVGVTRRYNHARGATPKGRLLRAHDGVDLLAKRGTRVYAGFSGTVIDPATRWRPWDPDRYGTIVVIESDEATSLGYVAFYAHLDSARVTVGEHVDRGRWIGRVGNTGNARSEPPQLHVELRAPFRIPVREGGRDRRIDAFDPYPSLIAADPRR